MFFYAFLGLIVAVTGLLLVVQRFPEIKDRQDARGQRDWLIARSQGESVYVDCC
jgi:cbb3-type cytochrome oxidase cytochrome c subunit